jgi:30S ribosomal protein S31
MGKGDKKTRRGKIILGSYGVRRPRKKTDKPEIKPVKVVAEKEPKEIKAVKEVKEIKVAKEKA